MTRARSRGRRRRRTAAYRWNCRRRETARACCLEATIVLLTLCIPDYENSRIIQQADRPQRFLPPPFSCSAPTSQAAAAASGGVGSGGGAVRAVCIEDGAAHPTRATPRRLVAAGVDAEIHEKAQYAGGGSGGGESATREPQGRLDFGRPPIERSPVGAAASSASRGTLTPLPTALGWCLPAVSAGRPSTAPQRRRPAHGRLLPDDLGGFFAGGEIGPPPKQDTNHTASWRGRRRHGGYATRGFLQKQRRQAPAFYHNL